MSPKWPLPAEDGARRATVTQIRHLTRQGVTVDLVVLTEPGDECDPQDARDALGVANVTIVRTDTRIGAHKGVGKLWSAARTVVAQPKSPLTFARYTTRRVTDSIAEVLEARGRYDVLVLDGLHAAGPYLFDETVRKAARAVVYRAHNVEADLWRQAASMTTNRVKRSVLGYEGTRIGAIERAVIKQVDHVVTVSDSDETTLRERHRPKAITTVPIPLVFRESPGLARSAESLLFVGRLDWPPNRDGLEWMIRNIWPAVQQARPSLGLTIVGSGDGSWLEQYRTYQGLKIVGRVADLAPYYEQSALALVPIRYGSGTKVKLLEAAAHGRPCLTTTLGAQGSGLPNEALILADSENEWVSTLRELALDRCQTLGTRAWNEGMSRFSMAVAGEKFRDVLGAVKRIQL